MPKPGPYKHFKGGKYRVLDVAKHTETGEVLVIYYAEGKPNEIWARPLAMFEGEVTPGVPRFVFQETPA